MKGKQYNTRHRRNMPIIEVSDRKQKQNASNTFSDLQDQESQLPKSQHVTESHKFEKQSIARAKKLKTKRKEMENQSVNLKSKRPRAREIGRDSQALEESVETKSSNTLDFNHLPVSNRKMSPTFFSGKKVIQAGLLSNENNQIQKAEVEGFAAQKRPLVSLKEEVEDMDCQLMPIGAVQLPSKLDLRVFEGMPASSESDDAPQDQHLRISKITSVIKETNLLPVKMTGYALLDSWQTLFESIASGQVDAKKIFDKIDANDPIKKSLLACHTEKFVKAIIDKCINAEFEVGEFTDDDIHINNKTFEVLIKDIATSIDNFREHKALFSIGLPTHHAYRERAAGYCIFNKVAILIHYFAHSNNVICGLDVNADDGLRDTLSTSNFPKSRTILHLDAYDPRVYPYFNPDVDSSFDLEPIKGQYTYTPMHLNNKSYSRKKASDKHPVILDMLNQINQVCQGSPKDTAVYLVLGWDSHNEEKAGCSNDLFYKLNKKNNEMLYRRLSFAESKRHRFNDQDFEHFYKELSRIIKKHEISFLYISLEGGYTEAVNKKQTEMLIKNLLAPEMMPREEEINQKRDVRQSLSTL